MIDKNGSPVEQGPHRGQQVLERLLPGVASTRPPCVERKRVLLLEAGPGWFSLQRCPLKGIRLVLVFARLRVVRSCPLRPRRGAPQPYTILFAFGQLFRSCRANSMAIL